MRALALNSTHIVAPTQDSAIRMGTMWTSTNRMALERLFESSQRGRAFISAILELGIGTIKVDSEHEPQVALLSYPPLNAIGGKVIAAEESGILEDFPRGNLLIVPDEEWESLLRKSWGDDLKSIPRTRLSTDHLSTRRLKQLKRSLPQGFEMKRLDSGLLERADPSMKEHVSMFWNSPEHFLAKGFGFCISHDKRVVSMASTFVPFVHEFEIQVDTVDSVEYRRKGFATAVCVALLEHGLKNGLVPCWDAANEASVKMALKLGYTNPDPYKAYVRWRTPSADAAAVQVASA